MFRFLASPRAFSLMAAPGIWLAHFTAVYVFASFACNLAGRMNTAPFLLSSLGVMTLTAAALVISGFGVAGNLRKWRAADAKDENDSAAFFARANALLHGLAIIAMLWVALPAFVLPPCPEQNLGW
jgi:hypothetical protein